MNAKVNIDLTEFNKALGQYIDDKAEEIAAQVVIDAKASSDFVDKTGKLRRSIRARKSKFEDGGHIVIADAPHAWLVEHGHGGPSPAPPHPYLKPALDRNIGLAVQKFNEGMK